MDLQREHIITILNTHRKSFYEAKEFADCAGHTVPCDTKSWSQILVSFLTGIPGLFRQKGNDLSDGSDVKAANAWDAIDKPRFNGVLKAGRIGTDHISISSLNDMPYIFFVLWDWINGVQGMERCRVWYVNTHQDKVFRKVAQNWYDLRNIGKIKSVNFQLHPPIHKDNNIVTNECGNLEMPLIFNAVWENNKKTYSILTYAWNINEQKYCKLVGSSPKRNRNS
jgi:hypothetical protein